MNDDASQEAWGVTTGYTARLDRMEDTDLEGGTATHRVPLPRGQGLPPVPVSSWKSFDLNN